MKGISLHTVIPLRAAPSDQAEMVSQILLGETYDLIEQKGHWCKVCLHNDHYLGWIGDKLFHPHQATKTTFDSILPLPYAEANPIVAGPLIRLVAGSVLKDLDISSGRFLINGLTYAFCDHSHQALLSVTCESPFQIATQWLGTPYLWGGKSCLGIDCSGLTQVIFSLQGIALPRDAKDQILIGQPIASLSQAKDGDLAFFTQENHSTISHVGILSGKGTIIHASGDVHIDPIDEKGIFSLHTQSYSHSLFSIRRYCSISAT